MAEGTDSTSTDTWHNPITFSLMDSEVICNPKKMSDRPNNIGLRDASASKNKMSGQFRTPAIFLKSQILKTNIEKNIIKNFR